MQGGSGTPSSWGVTAGSAAPDMLMNERLQITRFCKTESCTAQIKITQSCSPPTLQLCGEAQIDRQSNAKKSCKVTSIKESRQPGERSLQAGIWIRGRCNGCFIMFPILPLSDSRQELQSAVFWFQSSQEQETGRRGRVGAGADASRERRGAGRHTRQGEQVSKAGLDTSSHADNNDKEQELQAFHKAI